MDDVRCEGVDLVLIAGDLFESERVTPDTVEFLRQQFEGLEPARVFIAPGNHDPYIPGSPYKEELWPENVHVFDNEDFQSVEIHSLGIRVTGFGFERAHLEIPIFQKLPVLSSDYFNIVVSHGSNMGQIPSGKSKHGPFNIDDIAGKNIQYCALGHYHQQQLLPNPIDNTPCWYSGIPEGRGWDETGSCGYLFGEFTDGNLAVENRICNQYKLETLELDCDSFSTREQILDAVLDKQEGLFDSNTILRIQLVGALDPRMDLSLPELNERMDGQALYIQWDDRTHPAWDFQSLAQEKTLRGRFVHTMNESIDQASGEEKILLEHARLYGVQALSGHQVRLR
jgi:DNA repair exonuclease SbcCD nuclease subunit